MLILLPALLLSLLVVFTLERSTARTYLLADAFLLGLSVVASTGLKENSSRFFYEAVSFGILFSLVTGLALLFQIYVNYPVTGRE